MRVIIDPGVLQKLTEEGATTLLVEIGVTVSQIAHLTLMVPEISDQQLQGQVNQHLQGQDQKKDQKGRPFRSGRREVPREWLSYLLPTKLLESNLDERNGQLIRGSF